MAKKTASPKAVQAKQPSNCSSGLCTALLVLLLAIVVGGSVYLYQHTEYVFDQHTLQAISKRAIAKHGNSSVKVSLATLCNSEALTVLPCQALVDDVVAQLRQEYSDHILPEPESVVVAVACLTMPDNA